MRSRVSRPLFCLRQPFTSSSDPLSGFVMCLTQTIELFPENKFILRGEDYTVCSRWGVCVIKLQPSFGGDFWILGDVFMEVRMRLFLLRP